MAALLIVALLMAPVANPADGPTDSKAGMKECLARLSLDDLISDGDGVTKCLREYGGNGPKDDLENVDPIAKKVADDEAEKYSIASTADNYDPNAVCVQAALTARAYLDAKMPVAYDRWKATERRRCAEADRTARARN
ncbi:hypothetical protein [Sphingomonas pruni]|uniref:hypothetical protein n=1 Tax=Sphingomonas pruni TaxID=40683 RepID=UPI000829E056|nr:hypothetical protein [Sphingomonas pruni]